MTNQIAERFQIVEALLRGIEQRDEILAAVSASPSREEARGAVASMLDVRDLDAEAVLDLRVARFTRDEVEALRAEREQLAQRLNG